MNVTELGDHDLSCPFCYGKILRAKHTSETPHKGDYAFCSYCGNVGVFTDRTMFNRCWRVRKPTPIERLAISTHPGVMILRREWMMRKTGVSVH